MLAGCMRLLPQNETVWEKGLLRLTSEESNLIEKEIAVYRLVLVGACAAPDRLDLPLYCAVYVGEAQHATVTALIQQVAKSTGACF